MQLICDAITVLGSRHGLLLNPIQKSAGLLRFGRFDEMPAFPLRAGVRINGRELLFPLAAGETFGFLDQRMTPCSSVLIGIDPTSGVKVRLSLVSPFRPRDPEFSTTPVIGLRLTAEMLPGQFRMQEKSVEVDEVELFLEIAGEKFTISESETDSLDLRFESEATYLREDKTSGGDLPAVTRKSIPQQDRLVALHGRRDGRRFVRAVRLDSASQPLTVAWCAWSEPVFELHNDRLPFRYTARFGGLDAVAKWARSNPDALFENARKVDQIVARNNCSKSLNNLLAFSLHSWLANTWWLRNGERDWFSVWEGSCYFHSTVDVEFTQAPFYLAVWPELLKMELDQWPEFARDGAKILGDIGEGTRFLSHDAGSFCSAGLQHYPHDMAVEETANYLILSFVHWRRTGDDSQIRTQNKTLVDFLWFLIRADTTGNGVPDQGVANTIDDGSPAIQYGNQQVYLALKTLAALRTGIEMLALLGHEKLAGKCQTQAGLLQQTILDKGWQKDHFAVLLEKSGRLKNPWTGVEEDFAEIPGWDAPHIYSGNALGLLDMVGFDLGLPKKLIDRDLEVAASRCEREYGCIHTDFSNTHLSGQAGLAGAAANPGWISMNMARDIAAFYREIDLRHLADRYWEWQTVTNTQAPCLFFETFGGNNLHFYPRGVAVWGYFDALGRVVVDQVKNHAEAQAAFPGVRVPFLLYADWNEGNVTVVEGRLVSG